MIGSLMASVIMRIARSMKKLYTLKRPTLKQSPDSNKAFRIRRLGLS